MRAMVEGVQANPKKASILEARALAHPLRLKIVQLCAESPRTNQELARELEEDPGNTLHHVRILVRHQFLEAGDVRNGRRGALERPYRSTGKAWTLELGLEMRSACESCGAPLEAVDEVFICSYECTWCPDCAARFEHVCPNCGGELVHRPRRLPRPSTT